MAEKKMVDVETGLQVGDIITDAEDLGPVRSWREVSVNYGPNSPHHTGIKVRGEFGEDLFGAPQQVEVTRK